MSSSDTKLPCRRCNHTYDMHVLGFRGHGWGRRCIRTIPRQNGDGLFWELCRCEHYEPDPLAETLEASFGD